MANYSANYVLLKHTGQLSLLLLLLLLFHMYTRTRDSDSPPPWILEIIGVRLTLLTCLCLSYAINAADLF